MDIIEKKSENSSPIVTPREVTKRKKFPSIFGFLFLLIIFLAPIAIFPGAFPFSFVAKLSIVSTLAGLSIIFLLLNTLKTGEFEFPLSFLILSLALIPISTVISSFFSGNVVNSFAGIILEVGTSGSIVLFAILFMLAVIAGSRKTMIKRSIVVFLTSMGLAMLYSFVIVFMQYKEMQAVVGLLPNLVGSYIDFSILLSVAVILCLYFLSFEELNKGIKSLLSVLTVLALLIIGATGFLTLNIMLGVTALIIFVLTMLVFRNGKSFWNNRLYYSLGVLLVSVLFIVNPTVPTFNSQPVTQDVSLSSQLASFLKVDSFDVRPNIETTYNIAKLQLGKSIVTGPGPNKFVELFALYKPVSINEGNFWNVDFSYGFGLLPTLFATTGLLGLISIVLFLLILIKKGLGVFRTKKESPTGENYKFASGFLFLVSIFLWISTVFYIPSISVLAFTFIFSGLFAVSLVYIGDTKNVRINLFGTSLMKIVSVCLIVLFIVATVLALYFVWKKAIASVVFNKAIVAYNADADIGKAQNAVLGAIGISSSDLYERLEAELYLQSIEKIASSIPDSGKITESQKAELQDAISKAIAFAKVAIAKNPTNYQNYMTIARIYESLARKGVEGTKESASSSYIEASKLNPSNPTIQLGLARVASFSGDVELSRTYINKAIELKKNYVDAYFTLAQLEAESNNVPGVIKAIERATVADPQNAGIYFQLGLIKYQTGDSAGAAKDLEKALSIVPNYANVQYFLGLSYSKLGRVDDAIKLFEDLKRTNPDNQEVTLILENLRSGVDPFVGAQPPIDSEPEKRVSPPIEEKTPEIQDTI